MAEYNLDGWTVPGPDQPDRRQRDHEAIRGRAQSGCRHGTSRSLARALIRVLEQLTDARVFDRPRVVVRMLGREPCRAIETVVRHADVLQGDRCAKAHGKIVNALRRVARAQGGRHDAHGVGCGLPVERRRVRQDRPCARRRAQVERAAERVAQLVVHAHAGRAERRPREPGAVERVGARVEVLRCSTTIRQRPRQRPDAFRGQQRNDRIGVRARRAPRRNGRSRSCPMVRKSPAAGSTVSAGS